MPAIGYGLHHRFSSVSVHDNAKGIPVEQAWRSCAQAAKSLLFKTCAWRPRQYRRRQNSSSQVISLDSILYIPGECDGTRVVNTVGMSDLSERLSLALALLGVMLLLTLFGHAWLPLSANSNLPRYDMPHPALPDWPLHGGYQDRA
jgi:hypothetical protein